MNESFKMSPKVNCGVWGTLEILIKKETSGKIWDKNENWLKPAVKKKEKLKISNCIPSMDEMTAYGGSETISSRISLAPNETKIQLSAKILPKTDLKRSRKSHKKNQQRETELKPIGNIQQDAKTYVGSLIDCRFNLPRVSAQLERLMGTNVVHLTDRKYMMELRQRIHEDFNEMLTKRIQNRESEEADRKMNLILNGSFSNENCPRKLLIVHSVILAKEMERQRNLLMEGKLTICPKELANHPVFMVNQSTNQLVAKKRSKLKTIRERNAERLIRQGKKWEKERIIYEEKEREREAEMKVKEMELLASESKFIDSREHRGFKVLTIKDKKFTDGEMDLEIFLKKENDLMADRLRPKEKKFDPYTKDIRIVDAKRRLSEASRPKLKSLIAKAASNFGKLAKKTAENTNKNENGTTDTEQEKCSDNDSPRAEVNASSMDSLKIDSKSLSQNYVDPMVAKLKITDNVKDLYALADEIIGGISNDDLLMTSKKSSDKDE